MRTSYPLLAQLLVGATLFSSVVQIGVVHPDAAEAQSASDFLTMCGGGTGALPSPFIRNGANIYYSAPNGRVGIDTSTPQAELDVNGKIRANEFSIGDQSLDDRYLRKDDPNAVSGDNIRDGSVGGNDIDPTTVQRRITGNCSGGNSFITGVQQDGSVSCGSALGGSSLLPYLAYEYGPAFVEYTTGAGATLLRKRLIARGYLRALPDGAVETRTMLYEDIREAGASTGITATPDISPLGENSPVICDTGYAQVSSYGVANTGCVVRVNGVGAVVSYFDPTSSPHQLPILRTAISNNAFNTFQKCGQYTLDAPYTDRQSNLNADANGACYGSRISVVANVPFVGNGVPSPVAGQGIAAEPVTAAQICKIRGYLGYASYSVATYNSCGDNALYIWNGSDFQLRSACGLPGRITALSCFRIE